MHLTDEAQRKRALDPTQSFIVQAPAGSGKTELLIQRFLKLLGHVNHPEEILAVTFTKKSAAEMRDRIMLALAKAVTDPIPQEPHAKTTWELAKKVLKQNQEKKWYLLDNPNRLRIQTIDSFNAWLARQLPALSHFGGSPDISNEPFFLYQEAVREFLSHLEEKVTWSETIEHLLLHLDNDLNKIESLLINMLQKRDQWLPYIMLNTNDPLLRKKLESSLQSIITDILNNLFNHFPKQYISELVTLADFAAKNLLEKKSTSPIIACENLTTLPKTHFQKDKLAWLGLAKLLLTDKLEWRKRFDQTIGFPAALKEPKQRMSDLIEQLSKDNTLHLLLSQLSSLPHHNYDETQWKILSSLHQILKIITAQLTLIFQQHGKIDYIENAHAALLALGTEEHPTDLALLLDYKLQHILVDEFQDTSHNQFRLIEKLIHGWEPGDGRTLFLVGDPMQSIYRFREAEVGLFIRARIKGIQHLYLKPLSLNINFRSVPNIIQWINHHFHSIFPLDESVETGAISFSPSQSPSFLTNHPSSEEAVTLHPFLTISSHQQAEAIISLIKKIKIQSPKENIAILVRSRSHLNYIIPALKTAAISYQAIDIDPLITRPVIQDLISLTKAFLHPADRLAWLAILRAPWCGLLLQDLLILSQNPSIETIWERLQCDETIKKLSEDAQIRLAKIIPILKNRFSMQRRESLRDWIEQTWYALGGPASTDQLSDLDDAAAFFKLLDQLDEGGDLKDFSYLDKSIEKLFATPTHQSDTTVQIMTIHNSKGLEFDTVILPHLECKIPYDDNQLLLWMERSNLEKNRELVLAPIHATGDDQDSIYAYIKKQQKEKAHFENGRLLYVAATRAKKQLHFFFSLKINHDQTIQTPTQGLLGALWPAIQENIRNTIQKMNLVPSKINPIENKEEKNKKYLKRFPTNWINPFINTSEHITTHQGHAGFRLIHSNPSYMGTVIHRILENICSHGKDWWLSKKQFQSSYIRTQLTQLGMLSVYLTETIEIILRAIQATLDDPRGQWILHSHLESKTEFQLTALINQIPQQLIIDRTFIDITDNIETRWIIDYKSSKPTDIDTNINIFLENEKKKYEPQMQLYYQAMKLFDSRPIRLGLYFPLISAWCELPTISVDNSWYNLSVNEINFAEACGGKL